jgi:transcription elongation GreA/GreB family factor
MININPTPAQKLNRNIERIKTLREAIKNNSNEEYIAGLQKELDRREQELKEIVDVASKALKG